MLSRSDQDWTDFKIFRDEVNEMLVVSKEEYLKEFFNTEDRKLQWKRIEDNSKIKSNKNSSNIALQTDEGMIKEPKRVATVLNNF